MAAVGTAVTLEELFGDAVPAHCRDRVIADLTLDSREIAPGGMFLACAGGTGHGLDHVADALRRGAVAVAWEPVPGVSAPDCDETVSCFPVRSLRQRLGDCADRFFARPSSDLRVIGVTGTNGKSSCAWLYAQALAALGQRCALMGTLGWGFPGSLAAPGLTTPDVINVHRRLACLREDGATVVIMEVSSHALDQGRVDGVRFRAAAFTNLSRDHLDYHGDLDGYGQAKARLFAKPGLCAAVINLGDPFGARLMSQLPRGIDRVGVALGMRPVCDGRVVWASSAHCSESGLQLDIESSWGTGRLEAQLLGVFNAENLLIVLGLLLCRGVQPERAIAALAEVTPPPGRLEIFARPSRPRVVVDYAHTPAALRQALSALRPHCRGVLWCVFGAGGDRDRGKRPEMGRVAASHADRVVLTDDNPRSEDPTEIVRDIRQGIPADCILEVIHDRRSAIRAALAAAGEDDIVLVAGKGHETVQQLADRAVAYSDREFVRELLEVHA